MGGRPWSAEEEAVLRQGIADGLDAQGITELLPGRSMNAVESQIRRLGAIETWKDAKAERRVFGDVRPAQEVHTKPDFQFPPAQPPDLIELVDRACRRVDTYEREEDPDYQRIVIETDEPIAILKAADLHFGGLDVAYSSMLEHLRLLFQTPKMYLQLFGDDINLMIMHRTVAARHDLMTPEEQLEFAQALIYRSSEEGKLLSLASGNHSSEFVERVAGFDLIAFLAKHAIPYFRGLGYIDLVLRHSSGEEQVYPMAFVHKTRFHSFMNPVHGNKRMQQLHEQFFPNRPLAKEYITAHTHEPYTATEGCLPHERTHFIKCGTFKTNCRYSQRLFGQGRIGVPTVVYHSDRFQHTILPTPWEAYRYMSGEDWKPCRASMSMD